MESPLSVFEELRKEKERLTSLYNHKILDTEPDPDYDRIVKVAAHVCDASVALISLIDRDRLWFKSRLGWDQEEAPRDFFCSHAIKGDHILEIPDTRLDERFRDHKLVTEKPYIRFYAGAPLISSDGNKLGTLCVLDILPKKLTAAQKESLDTLARQIVLQMELKLQKEQLKQLNTGLLNDLQKRIEQKDKILKLFSRFVPPEVISQHLHANSPGFNDAELKYCSILFCDIRGYTSLVENTHPRNAVAILNTFYTVMSDVIKTFSGVVVQYVGDEIFAIFGKPFSFPQFERNAVFCAMEMMRQLENVNKLCREYTDRQISIGIGINAGEVITGTLGSDEKIEFSVTGDNVNTAKRIESLTKEHPNTILISETVYEKVKDLVGVKVWDPINVKGKSQPLQIYEVTGKRNGSKGTGPEVAEQHA
ncbi:MAG: cyaA1 [Chitinophagaceae bacterium]|jgi:class 3 adenylate cyclase|nr:cyaA1 [Chitinophagaceae bacterium]